MGFDPFAILGLPRRFDVDRGGVERAYLARAAGVHPDVGEESPAEGGAHELNRARQVVLDPEARANVLLELLGGPSKEMDRSLPPGFLMEMMEVRERMEGAAGDPEELARWRDWANQQRDGHRHRVATLFAAMSGGAGATETLKQIRTELNAWRYIERMLEQLPGAGSGGGRVM